MNTHQPGFLPSDSTMRLVDRARRFEDEIEPWRRGIIATQVWRDHADRPVVFKTAEALARALEEIEPIILPEETFIGCTFRRLRVHAGVGEFDRWRVAAKNPEVRGYHEDMPVPPEVDAELRWWRDSDLPNLHASNAARRRHAYLGRFAIAHPHGGLGGHTLPDHGILLRSPLPRLVCT